MPKYARKTDRQSWSADSMKEAIEEVLAGRMGYLRASKLFNVPQTTLENRVKKAKVGLSSEDASKKGILSLIGLAFGYFIQILISIGALGSRKPVFTEEQENELIEHILQMEGRLFGLTLTDLRTLAFELAERNNIKHNFNSEKRMAGKCWLYSFLDRHKNVTLRTPEATSAARAMGFNKPVVEKFFQLLLSLYDKYKFTPDRIYNVDETGITTVPNKKSKVLSLKGKRQVGGLVSAERGQLVTAVVCMSASGAFMPTMFVFPRKRMNPELLDDALPGTTAECHSSGWMQREIFVKWFKRFIEFSKPDKDKPVLLLLDGHDSHVKSLDLIEMARANHVVILCFPPHCTHRMQPLDVSFMAPLSTYYSQQATKWLTSHPARVITIKQVAKIYGEAFMKAASIETAVNGFRKTGIYPPDPNIFPEWMFQPAETTDKPRPTPEEANKTMEKQDSTELQLEESNPPENFPPHDLSKSGASLQANLREEEPRCSTPTSIGETPGCSSGIQNGISDSLISVDGQGIPPSRFYISPSQIIPIPKRNNSQEGTRKVNRRRGKAAIITESPYKNELEEEQARKNQTSNQPVKRRLAKPSQERNARSRKKTTNDKNSAPKQAKRQPVQIPQSYSSSDEDEETDAKCVICGDTFSNSKSEEGWVKCIKCFGWAHEACAGVDPNDEDDYTCDLCLYNI